MIIPKIIHQTWKKKKIPKKWSAFQKKLLKLHPDWEYKLWTDDEIIDYVKTNYPWYFIRFISFPRNIMRVDIFRYLLMYKTGGLYLDLDYEMIKPFDIEDKKLVLPMNRTMGYKNGTKDSIGNAIFASAPGHSFWKAVIDYLERNTLEVKDYTDVVDVTGPGLLTKIYYSGDFNNIFMPHQEVFHPGAPKNKKEYKALLNNPRVYGIHHGWGVWKNRYSLDYFKTKLKKKQ